VAPISGGTLTVLADGHTVVAADPERDQIYVADLTQKNLLKTITLQPGDEPGRVLQDSEGRVHIVLRRSGFVLTLAPNTFEISERRPACAAPRGLAYDKARDKLVVACVGGELVQMAPTGASTQTVMLDKDLRDVVVMGDRYLISRFKTASLLSFNPATSKVETRKDAPLSLQANSKGTFKTNEGAYEALNASAGVAYRMVPVRGGGAVMLHQEASNSPLATRPGGYTGNVCKGSTVGATVTMVGDDLSVKSSGHFMAMPLPVDIAVSPSGKTFALVSAGADVMGGAMPGPFNVKHVTVISRSAAESNSGCVFPQGSGGGTDTVMGGGTDTTPTPSEIPPDIIEYRQPGAQTTAVAFDGKGRLLAQTREPAAIEVLSGAEVIKIKLSERSIADTGHSFFHMPVGNATLACASCHPEGGEDGRTWMFDTLGARRTQSLRGGVGATGPFHWDGDMKDLGQIMTDVFSGRMGGPMLNDGQKVAVNKFIEGIPALRPSPAVDVTAAARGKTVFNNAEVGCATCHNGAQFTNNTNVDVGTKKAFQVPSLIGISFRAPFMHNGCANTLAARFDDACGGTNHGKVRNLSASQLADLSAYLETL